MSDKPQSMQTVASLARNIQAHGGRAFFVGGFVRDRLLGLSSKDIDVEVFGLPLELLQEVLAEKGRVSIIGRQFGVLRLAGLEVDWSVPRRDSSPGRHPRVATDPSMSVEEASRRRDLTMNAMLQDVLTGEVIDPWNGRRDMEAKVLRTPDPKLFVQDPLRFYRVMQFAARFGMKPDNELDRVCRIMDIKDVSAERVEEEFIKLFLKARRPSLGILWLDETGRLPEVLPELATLKDTPQDKDWHPEGDVWRHTMQVVDAAAGLRSGDRTRDLKLMWAALCHDIGKPAVTVTEDGHIRTPRHEKEGEKLAGELLGRLVHTKSIVSGAVKLVAQHMQTLHFFTNQASQKAFKRLALKLAPEADLELLATLALADCRGMNPDSDLPLTEGSRMVDWFLDSARSSSVEKKPEKPVLMGRHLVELIEPGPGMGKVLETAYRIQLDEGIRDLETLRKRALGEAGPR